ncbi:MAG: Hcp family type VI secretion system effector [Mariniblastus sp.]
MAVDYFLKIDGIEGDSLDDKHKGEVELISYDWTETQSGSFAQGGGGGVGKVHMGSFEFVMHTCKASPKLALYCANGKHIKEATLTCRKAGEGQQDFYSIKMSDIIVSKYRTMSHIPAESTDNNNRVLGTPADEFCFDFGKIEFEYKPQKADGALDTPVKAGYNVKANKTV